MNNYMQMKNENKFKKNESQESQPHESSNLKLNLKLNSNLNNHDSLSALLDDNNQEEEEELTTIHNAIENLVKEEKHLEAARVIRKIRKQKQKQQQQSLATSTSTSTSTQTSKSKSNSKQQQQQLFDNEYYTTIIQKAELIERAVNELLSSPEKEEGNDAEDDDDNTNSKSGNDDNNGNVEEEEEEEEEEGWIKQGGSHLYSNYDYTIYYKVDDSTGRLTCRIESPIPSNLLIPLLSVFNESSLYETWVPSWSKPRLGIKKSNQLLHDTRGHQIIQVECYLPWPFNEREALFSVLAVDDIDTNGFIIAKMTSLELTETITTSTTNNDDDNDGQRQDAVKKVISSPQYLVNNNNFQLPDDCTKNNGKMVQCEFDGALLFRNCPIDHPNYEQTKHKFGTLNTTSNDDESNDNDNNDILLLQFMMYFDAKIGSAGGSGSGSGGSRYYMNVLTQSIINFITRTVIGVVWNMLLKVAEEVRDGVRTQHCDIINIQKIDFYNWVKERCHYMLQTQQQKQKNSEQHQREHQQQRLQHQHQHQQPQKNKDDNDNDDTNNTMTNDYDNWTLQEVLRMSI